jgi:hypothetical protein
MTADNTDLVIEFNVRGETLDALNEQVTTKVHAFFGTELPVSFVIHAANEAERWVSKNSDEGEGDWCPHDPPVFKGRVFASRSAEAVAERIKRYDA